MKRSIIYLTLAGMLTIGSYTAHAAEIVIDPTGVDMQQYQDDLVQCHLLSRQVRPKAGRGAVGGAVVGGIVGRAVGNRHTARRAARAGAVGGLVRGAAITRYQRHVVVRNCLHNRGYNVLN